MPTPQDLQRTLTLAARVHLDGEPALDADQLGRLQEGMRLAGREAALSPIDGDARPRMLKITAFIAHAGPPNRNGDAFLLEDLEEVVRGGLFSPPHLGMIDFNHDFSAYGAWYATSLVYDTAAQQYGILAEGAIWAWRYEELANTLLAMQQRQGHIAVSMACLPQDIERAQDANGRDYWILRKPVFVTTSVLDVDPADPNGRGIGTESNAQTPQEREQILLNASAHPTTASAETQEEDMDPEKLLAELRAAMAEENAALVEQLTELAAAAARLPTVEAELSDLTLRHEMLTEAHRLLTEARDTEVNAHAATQVALTAAQETLATMTTELEGFRAAEAERAAEAAKQARLELKEARLAQLPEAYRRALEAKPETDREAVTEYLTDLDEEKWEAHLASLTLLGGENKYEAATRKEGALTTAKGSEGKGRFEIDTYFDDK